MAVIPFDFQSTGDRQVLSSLAEIVGLSKIAQQEVKDIATAFQLSAASARLLVAEMGELRGNLRGAGRQLNTLNKRLDPTEANMRKLAESTRTAQAELGKLTGGGSGSLTRVSNTAQRASRGIGSLQVAIGNLASQAALRVVDSLARAIQDLATASIDAALATEGLVRTLDIASTGRGAELFQELAESADELGIALEAVAPQFANVAVGAQALGISGDDTLLLFEGINKAATELAISTDDLSGIFLALQQIIAKNRLSAEELNQQLAERFPLALEIARRAIGATNEEFADLLEQGITATEFIPAFARELNNTFVGATDSAQAELARFNNAIFELQLALGEELLPVLVDVAGVITEFLREGNTIDTIVEQARRLALIFQGILELTTGTSAAAREIRESFAGVLEVLEGSINALTTQFRLVDGIVNALGGPQILRNLEFLGQIRNNQADAERRINEQLREQQSLGESIQDIAEDTNQTIAERARLAEQAADAEKEAEQAAKARLNLIERETSRSITGISRLQQDFIDDAEKAELDAIETTFNEREDRIKKAADIEAQAIEDRLDAEQQIADFRLQQEQDAQQELLDQRFTLLNQQLQDELAIREGANRALIEREAAERRRIEEELARVRAGEFLDTDILELAQQILNPNRTPQQIQFLDAQAIQELQALLPELERAQQEGLGERQAQERLAQEALLNSQRVISEQEIAEIRRNEAAQLAALELEQTETQIGLEAAAQLARIDIEADARQQQRDLDRASAEEIAALNIAVAERIAQLQGAQSQRLRDAAAAATPIPRRHGGTVYPGNLYSIAEDRPEILNVGGQQHLFTEPRLITVERSGNVIPRVTTGVPGSSAQLASIDKGIKKLTRMVAERPIEPKTINHFDTKKGSIGPLSAVYRAQNRAFRSNL